MNVKRLFSILESGFTLSKPSPHYSITPLLHYLIPILLSFLPLICLTADTFADQKVDFLIIENLKSYSILDKYEQPISGQGKDIFQPYAPLQIINDDATLGDAITEAMKVQHNHKLYYLLKDDNGNLVGDKKSLYRQTFKNCEIVEDTVSIIKARSILLAVQYPGKGKRTYLKKDENCIRMFRYKNLYYIQTIGSSERYGWCSLSQKGAWKIVEHTTPQKDYVLSSFLQERIVARIDKANRTYIQYFEYFNQITHQQKSIPQWRYTSGEDMIHCTLTGTYQNTEQLEESTYYLVQDLENMLLGKPYVVEYQTGEIVIKKKE